MPPIPTDYVSLTTYLQSHLDTERGALEAYERLVSGRPDDLVTYLVKAILRDEARHHELFGELLNSLESKIRWEEITPRVPPPSHHVADRDELLETTEKLLELEEEDAKELKELRKGWSKSGGEFGIWAVLVEGAELDTEKHIRMLKCLRELLEEAESGP